MKQTGTILFQVVILLVISLMMNGLVQLLQLPIPGSIIGMLLLFILLKTGIVKLRWIEAGASWLLAEMLLFFIPSAVGIMNHLDLMRQSGLSILLVILISTFVVMALSGLAAQAITKRKENKPYDSPAVSPVHHSHLSAGQKNV